MTIIDVQRRTKGPNQFVVTDWRDPSERLTLAGSGMVGEEVDLYSHEGWLGFAWIERP